MNLFYATLDSRISKFKVYNVHTMADEFMVVSGMPNRIGENLRMLNWSRFNSCRCGLRGQVGRCPGGVNVITHLPTSGQMTACPFIAPLL